MLAKGTYVPSSGSGLRPFAHCDAHRWWDEQQKPQAGHVIKDVMPDTGEHIGMSICIMVCEFSLCTDWFISGWQ